MKVRRASYTHCTPLGMWGPGVEHPMSLLTSSDISPAAPHIVTLPCHHQAGHRCGDGECNSLAKRENKL